MGNLCNGTTDENGSDAQTGTKEQMMYIKIHTDAVVSLALTETGQCLSGSKDKNLVLFDYKNNKIVDKWSGHEREITKVCSGQSRYFSASRDKGIKMWESGNPNSICDFIGHDLVVTAIHCNQNGDKLCSGSRDNSVRLWDVTNGVCLAQDSIAQNLVTDLKWIPKSDLILQTGEDKEVRIYDSRNLDVVQNFPKKQYIQMSCDVTDDGLYCLTCSNGFSGNGCEATLWDIRTKKILNEYYGHREAVESCIFLPSPHQALLATVSRDCSIRIWNRETKECVSQFSFDGSGPLTSVVADAQSQILVGTFNKGVQILNFTDDNLSVLRSY